MAMGTWGEGKYGHGNLGRGEIRPWELGERGKFFAECLETLLPAVTAVINQSLQTCVFPFVFKEAIVKPLLKKPSLDPNSLKNYRPVSNLSFFVKSH